MQQPLGPLRAEVSDAESAKFTAPLVLIHGLWDDARSWRPFTSFLSHRGWRCVSVDWPAATRVSIEARTEALGQAIAQLDEVPILIGHDLGGLLALRLAEHARAVVALAPLVPLPLAHQPAAALGRAGSVWQRWRDADRGPGRALAGSYPVAAGIESASLLAELQEDTTEPPPATGIARLVLAAAGDPLVSVDDARALATAHGCEFETVAGEHPLHLEDGWESHVGRVHRWLIKSLGEDLLAFYEEAWADRED